MAWPKAMGAGCAVLLALAAPACLHDFDEPFAQPIVAPPSGSGGAGGTSSAGGSSSEDPCDNRADDDGDGDVDCADADCDGFDCVAAAPGGWDGPFLISSAASRGALASCASGKAELFTLGGGELSVPAATCAPCACGAPVGTGCGIGWLDCHRASDCSNISLAEVKMPPAANTCYPLNLAPELDGDDGFHGQPVPLTAAPTGCPPSGGGVSEVPAVGWDHWVRACELSAGGGCGAELCLPDAAGAGQFCISQAGDVKCPSQTPFRARELLYQDAEDTRTCQDCGCDAPTGVACNGITIVYDELGCGGASVNVIHGGGCAPTGGVLMDSYRFLPDTPSGSCLPNGGAAVGTVTPTEPLTLCCL